VNVERFNALKAAGLMTPAGEAAYERDKHRSGVYSYEKPLAELTADEEALFRKNAAAWAHWEKRPAGYRRSALGWVTGAKRGETRAKRLAELIETSGQGRRLAQYDWRKKS
jgi:uncharacterized protein YdeI (YjbR/CyaY-like superfamily)